MKIKSIICLFCLFLVSSSKINADFMKIEKEEKILSPLHRLDTKLSTLAEKLNKIKNEKITLDSSITISNK